MFEYIYKFKDRNSVTRCLLKLYRQGFVMGDIKRPIIPFMVNLLYWRPKVGKNNVGDFLSKVIFDYLLKYYKLSNFSRATYRISCIGSILNFISADCIVWGSGFLSEVLADYIDGKDMKWDIRAVRGPRTRDVLLRKGYSCPEVYGDPAILLPMFYNPEVEQTNKVLIVPHYSKYNDYASKYDNVLDTRTNDWKLFVKRIKSAKFVISASLHGIILAESYGIPALFLNDVEHDLFKYEDYYFSTCRNSFKKATSVQEGLKLGPELPPPNILILRNNLLKSFPIDLWKR